MKRKLFIVCLVIGCIFLLLSIAGFIKLNGVKENLALYDGSTNDSFKHVQDPKTYQYYDTYWDYLENHECMPLYSYCYCDHVNNENACINQYLNEGGGTYKEGNSQTSIIIIKNRFLWIILSIASFVVAWVFYEKKENKEKAITKSLD